LGNGKKNITQNILYFAGSILLIACAASCGINHHAFSPAQKYPPSQLQKDYSIYQETLEQAHPGLYWYTSKDSMDYYFAWGREQLKDSLTEPEFRRILTYVTSKINCGHTSIRASKAYSKYSDTVRIFRVFPLSMKLWPDTAVVAATLSRRDTILKRGTMLTTINNKPITEIVDTLFKYLSTDGYNTTHKYQALSNRGFFGSMYSSLFGYSRTYSIGYIDSAGNKKTTVITPYFPAADTSNRSEIRPAPRLPKPSRKDLKNLRRNAVRLLRIDSSSHVAMMDLNSFGRGYGLKGFFKRSFKALRKNDIGHLIIDVRGNGGGSVTNSTQLTRYMTDHEFKVGDSLYAVAKRKRYSRYVQNDFFNRLFMTFFTKKLKDGNYHFRYFERHYFKPKKKNHFEGKVYILTGGNSFSATTLFTSALMKQNNITVVGEETGGGAYGNSAWLIPYVTLPETKVRFRLPLFRLVIDKNTPKDGKGVQPEIESRPTIDAIKRGADYKIDKVMELIEQDKKLQISDLKI
jgi:hypothetical protein